MVADLLAQQAAAVTQHVAVADQGESVQPQRAEDHAADDGHHHKRDQHRDHTLRLDDLVHEFRCAVGHVFREPEPHHQRAARISGIELLVTVAISISAVVKTAITSGPSAGAEATEVRRQAR